MMFVKKRFHSLLPKHIHIMAHASLGFPADPDPHSVNAAHMPWDIVSVERTPGPMRSPPNSDITLVPCGFALRRAERGERERRGVSRC